MDFAHSSGESSRPMTPLSPAMAGAMEEPPKMKGRHRFLHGLQCRSSSPSLSKMGRTRSSEKVYRSSHKASMSCVSLGSSPTGYSISPPILPTSSQTSNGYSTPPTTPGSPLHGHQFFEPSSRIRLLETNSSSSSIATPGDLRTTKTTLHEISEKPLPKREDFNFWRDLPQELRIQVFSYLSPTEIIRLSSVSKSWHEMCFDGQLWTSLDCQQYYQQISSETLIRIMLKAGAFVKNLNLRGCVQLRDQWLSLGTRMTNQECRNLETFNIEGCKIERSSIHFFLLRNPKLIHINMPSMQQINNSTMRIIAAHCPQLEFLNIDWCSNVDTKGLKKIVQSCPNLSDLRANEIRGLDDEEFILELFKRNKLERLFLQHCDSMTDDILRLLLHGEDPSIDVLTDQVMVPPRRLRHLDLSECKNLTDDGVKALSHCVPFLEGLRLCRITELTDDAFTTLLPTLPRLTHLELDELENLTNSTLQLLARSPAAKTLEHLSLSFTDQIGDIGVLPILKTCPNLGSLCLDNTRISDLVLIEASEQVRKRGNLTKRGVRPRKGLRLIAFDCANVTWAGVREVMQGNSRVLQGRKKSIARAPTARELGESETDSMCASASQEIKRVIEIQTLLYPAQTIYLKTYYNWQPTVEEHYKRCMTARWDAASRLEGKWAEWMVANEEVNIAGHGWASRRRRRRAREAETRVNEDRQGIANDTDGLNMTGTETEDLSGLEIGGSRRPAGRRRARSGGCSVM